MQPRLTLLFLFWPAVLLAAAPPDPVPTAHGDQLRDAYFRHQASLLARPIFDAGSHPELRQQFLAMMGLWPLPPRTDLKATVVGTIEMPTYRVEKLHFQSMPGLYVSANLYLPTKVAAPCPGILYVCGHGPSMVGNVSHGNKVTYQHHGRWFAENGYVCLIVDTLQLGELQGLHHGTSRFDMWWWVSLGYTPAGVELWNGMRGLDYLQTRKEVDPARLAVTGRSGGGATSWWVGAADERVRCIVPVAGIADLRAHVAEGYPGRLADGVVAGHCDCMYMVNTYRWDYTQVMALCAPRALLLGNSDEDVIFPVPGYRRMAGPVRELYQRLGAADRFALLETKGPHKDTPELRQGAFRWLNRWLKNESTEVKDPDRPRLTPQQLKVFDRPPSDAINDVVHERFRRPARIELPRSADVVRAWWPGKSRDLLAGLNERVFRGWPAHPPALATRASGERLARGIRVRAFDFVSEEKVPLRAWLVESDRVDRPGEVIACALDEAGWQQWLADLGPEFQDVLHKGGNPAPLPYPALDETRLQTLRTTMQSYRIAYVLVAPRGVGPTRWDERALDGKPAGHQIRRRFYLLGQTLEGQQIWDIRRAVQAVAPTQPQAKWTLQGKGHMAVLCIYAGLFEPAVQALDLWEPPASHLRGPALLNVLTVLDVPQALGLFLPRPVTLHASKEKVDRWNWCVDLHRALGGNALRLSVEE